jgi:hypothetical protein
VAAENNLFSVARPLPLKIWPYFRLIFSGGQEPPKISLRPPKIAYFRRQRPYFRRFLVTENHCSSCSARIVIWLMNHLCHGGVLMKVVVDGGVAIRLGPIIRVVGDVGRRLALVGHSIGREDGARLATM